MKLPVRAHDPDPGATVPSTRKSNNNVHQAAILALFLRPLDSSLDFPQDLGRRQ